MMLFTLEYISLRIVDKGRI